MLSQPLPRSAEQYAKDQRTEFAAALTSVKRSWSRMGTEFDASYAAIETPLLTTVYVAQARVAESAAAYIPAVMADMGRRVRTPEYVVDTLSMMGTAGDGRRVDSLLYSSVIQAKSAVGSGVPVRKALSTAGMWMMSTVGTLLSDTARMNEQAGMKSRHVRSYIRTLSPPSCGRCVILAGIRYSTDEAFDRHPACDCKNLPAPDGEWEMDPREHLDGLPSAAELDKQYPELTSKMRRESGLQSLEDVLGSKANAQAYRDGADMNQLVNAYRKAGSVSKAQVYGRTVTYTTEGVTRRGWAHDAMSQANYLAGQGVTKVGRYNRLNAPRLMPSSIYKIATSRDDALRLLKLYGWVL